VRRRPGMYIGSTDKRGLHHLVYEIVDNSVDEAMAGFCDEINVVIRADGSISVRDNGRGIPTGVQAATGKSALEVALTVLHAGGKFGGNGYKVSGGLHGVGVSVVNALSEWLEAKVCRDGKVFRQTYTRGETTSDVDVVGEADGTTGTQITFKPDGEIFETLEFDYNTLRVRFREMAFLNKGIRITLRDERTEPATEHDFCYEGGISSYVDFLNKNKQTLIAEPLYMSGADGERTVEVALQYNDSYNELIHSYANNIATHEGGTHETGFRSALTRVLNDYARRMNFMKSADESLSGEDVREGIVAIISVKLPEPQFEGQTKTKLGNSVMRTLVESVVVKGMNQYLEENPKAGKAIIDKCLMARRAREAARKARDVTRKKSGLFSMPSKLAPQTSKNPEESELFIVEGDSAGGSAKSGRDRRTQAILPLRGKILNVEKARLDRALDNEEIRAMITILGTGIGEDFNIENLRYHKVIIMTDADVDGSHIRTLLLTFFYRYMRPLVEQGHVYIAQPPLYKMQQGKQITYAYDDEQLRSYMDNLPAGAKVDVQRYKGLGEMNADQLKDTTMDPEKRTLLKVTVDDTIGIDEVFTVLMGQNVEPRREFIINNSDLVADLDV
ncbi:MAG: DNA topoisomerase (ATP-hydrolyzing) subunit B, partial [Christensenellaceae bacterium]